MIDSLSITRTLFEDFRPLAVTIFYAIGYGAIGIFLWGTWIQIRKYRYGTAYAVTGTLISRFKQMTGTMLTHRTLVRRDHAAGGAHALIFFGFALLFLGTSTITVEYDILKPLTGMRFWYGDFYLWFSLVLDVAGFMLGGGLVFMMWRRGWLKPPKLNYARPDRSPADPDYDRKCKIMETLLWPETMPPGTT